MVYGFDCRVVARLALVVQVSGGTLTRTSSVTPPIKTKSNLREQRVDTIFGAGLRALLFFMKNEISAIRGCPRHDLQQSDPTEL
jgi:hypothetical protein